MKVELTQEDINNIIKIINAAQINGGSAEAIVSLKQKLSTPVYEKTKENENEVVK